MTSDSDSTPKPTRKSRSERPKTPVTIDLQAESKPSAGEPESAQAPEPPLAAEEPAARSDPFSSEATPPDEPAPTVETPAEKRSPLLIPAVVGALAALLISGLVLVLQSAGILSVPRLAVTDRNLGTLEASLSGIQQRVSSLEQADSGAAASDLDALSRRIDEANSAGSALDARLRLVETALAALDGQSTPSDFDALATRVKALEDSIATIRTDLSTIAGRLDTVAAQEATRTESNKAARMVVAESFRQAASGSGPFAAELDLVAGLLPGNPDVATLTPLAARGVPSSNDIAAAFPAIARAVLSAAPVAAPEQSGMIGQILSLGQSLVTIRSTEPMAGDDPMAIVSRMEAALARKELVGAMAEYDALPSSAKTASADWARDARDRIKVDGLAAKLAEALASPDGAG